ncbi:MAG TPA: MerR family transcriptional regulator [Xanthomonadales bacterium]|nr:MerR family transcriptional regulator [Xanthomonadales bacterium]
MTLGQSQVNVLSIQKFAAACHTTPRTLRLYQKLGLFKPEYIDPDNKYRYYSATQRKEFLRIKLLQNFHLPLKEIKSKNINLKKFVETKLDVLQEEIKDKESERKFLKQISSFLLEEDYFKKQIKTEYVGPYTLFCHKIENARYDQITNYIISLWKEAEKLKLKCQESEITFYLDKEYNSSNTGLEIALICQNKREVKKLPENHYFRIYPKTKAIACTYTGPYEYLTLIYQRISDYMSDEKIRVMGLVFEKYKYGPLNYKSKYGYVTKVVFPTG